MSISGYLLCQGAESQHTVVRLSVTLSVTSVHAERWELKLGMHVGLKLLSHFEHVKVAHEVLFSSYGVICLPY